jgi:hypothetical protein
MRKAIHFVAYKIGFLIGRIGRLLGAQMTEQGNRQVPSWDVQWGMLKISRRPFSVGFTVWGYGISYLILPGKRKLSFRRPSPPLSEEEQKRWDGLIASLGDDW